MDMHSREQYLETLREDYRRASRKEKSRLLNEARRRTRLARKVLIRKLAHPAKLSKPKPKRGVSYGAAVVTKLVEVWEWFDFALRAAPSGGIADGGATFKSRGAVEMQRRSCREVDEDLGQHH